MYQCLNQKPYKKPNSKSYYVQIVRFWDKNLHYASFSKTTFTINQFLNQKFKECHILNQNMYKFSDFGLKSWKRHNFFQIFYWALDFEMELLQPVRLWLRSCTRCHNWIQNFHNLSDFESEVLEHVAFSYFVGK